MSHRVCDCGSHTHCSACGFDWQLFLIFSWTLFRFFLKTTLDGSFGWWRCRLQRRQSAHAGITGVTPTTQSLCLTFCCRISTAMCFSIVLWQHRKPAGGIPVQTCLITSSQLWQSWLSEEAKTQRLDRVPPPCVRHMCSSWGICHQRGDQWSGFSAPRLTVVVGRSLAGFGGTVWSGTKGLGVSSCEVLIPQIKHPWQPSVAHFWHSRAVPPSPGEPELMWLSPPD